MKKKFEKFYHFKSCEEEQSWKCEWNFTLIILGNFREVSLLVGSVQVLRCFWQASEKTVWLFKSLTALLGSLLVYSCSLGCWYKVDTLKKKPWDYLQIDKVLICGYGCEDILLSLKT